MKDSRKVIEIIRVSENPFSFKPELDLASLHAFEMN